MSELEPREDGQMVAIEDLETEEDRVYQAYRLHLRGVPWLIVAEQTGYANAKSAEVTVRNYIQRAGMEMDADRRQEMLTVQLDRINALIETQWTKAEMGDTKAADFCLRAIGQIGKYAGLEALHQKETQSSKTIVITGTQEDYVRALKQITEE